MIQRMDHQRCQFFASWTSFGMAYFPGFTGFAGFCFDRFAVFLGGGVEPLFSSSSGRFILAVPVVVNLWDGAPLGPASR